MKISEKGNKTMEKLDLKEKEKKFSEIYAAFRDKVYRICYGYIYEKEQTADLFQEIMINIWNSLDRFRGESKIGTWIYKVAVNTALLYNRKSKKFRLNHFVRETLPEMSEPENDEPIRQEEKLNLLAQCISQLDKNDRVIITLILENLTYDEVAEITGITPNHVGVKVNRIKKRLFSMLKEMNYE